MDRDRLMIFVIVGRRTDLHCLRTQRGRGLDQDHKKCQENLIRVQRLQQWLQDGKKILSSGGLEAGGRCSEEVAEPDRTEDRSF